MSSVPVHEARDDIARGALSDLGNDVEIEVVRARPSRHRILASAADEDVVARAAVQGVVAGETEKLVVPGIARHHVGDQVSGALDGQGPEQGQVLKPRRQSLGDGRFHQIDARGILQHVADGVDDEGVVAGAAVEGIGPEPAVENVGGAVARDGVGKPVAGSVDGSGPEQRQLLDRPERSERAADGRGDGVDAG